jgi:hypothetical protein
VKITKRELLFQTKNQKPAVRVVEVTHEREEKDSMSQFPLPATWSEVIVEIEDAEDALGNFSWRRMVKDSKP